MVYRKQTFIEKKVFSVAYVKINELRDGHT